MQATYYVEQMVKFVKQFYQECVQRSSIQRATHESDTPWGRQDTPVDKG